MRAMVLGERKGVGRMADGDKLPTIGEWVSSWLGVQLPTVRLPQSIKNLDKAIGKLVLASGENLEARIKGNTGKVKAKGEIVVDGMFRTAEEERKIKNRAATTKVAIEELEREPASEDAKDEITDDWLNMFARIAEDKSSEELQELFGRILAGEVKRPGSFSLRTIQILSTVSKNDADEISKYLSFAVEGSIVPVFEKTPSYVMQLLMNELGIAGSPGQLGGSIINYTLGPNSNKLLMCSGFGVLVTNASGGDITVEVAGQILTTTGRELLTIARPGPTELNYLSEIANTVHKSLKGSHSKEVEEKKINVSTVQIIGKSDGQLQCRTIGRAPIEGPPA